MPTSVPPESATPMPGASTPTVSVLMSVYRNTRADELTAALDSLLQQTRRADEILIVEDGPLTPELYEVLEQHCREHPTSRRLPLPVNQGLGPALQAGLETIETDFVARLDSDDIAAPERFARQLACFTTGQNLDVVRYRKPTKRFSVTPRLIIR